MMKESLTHKVRESRSPAMVLIWSVMMTSLVAPVKVLAEGARVGALLLIDKRTV